MKQEMLTKWAANNGLSGSGVSASAIAACCIRPSSEKKYPAQPWQTKDFIGNHHSTESSILSEFTISVYVRNMTRR